MMITNNRNKFLPSIIVMMSSLLASSCTLDVKDSENVMLVEQALASGNVAPEQIQIDGPLSGADLFASDGAPMNPGATIDWVADAAPNVGTGCLTPESLATCVEPGVTGAPHGSGHWNGVRIVDGLGSNDGNIFLTGGKENDVLTWNVGPGSVGSSKYDISQAYLASNKTTVYFGMERSGNNGTTAFDFEFNQLQPGALRTCPQLDTVPCRSVGDVLFTFEMQGSGGSGTATPHVYTWNGSKYVEGAATGIMSSINNSTTTKGAPWGHVDSHGNWVLGNMDRFTFAEAAAPISLLPGSNGCGGQAFVQVRTRSSAVATSDLKDTTKYFQFVYNSISATATLTPSCDGTLAYSANGVSADGTTLANPTCSWTFSDGSTTQSCVGTLSNLTPGTYSATVQVADAGSPECGTNVQVAAVDVLQGLSVSLHPESSSLTCPEMTTDAVTYAVSISGGDGDYVYSWSDPGCTGSTCTVDPSDASMCYEQSLTVSVADGSELCAPVTSETETYRKVTTVTASDN